MHSLKRDADERAILWVTDWSSSKLFDCDSKKNSGTKIIIKQLRDKWSKLGIHKLSKYLSRTYNDNLMSIDITFENEIIKVERYFHEPIPGYNCVSKIDLSYVAEQQTLLCTVRSDEFLSSAKEYCNDVDIENYREHIDILSVLENDKDLSVTEKELDVSLKELGDFSAELYFHLKGGSSKDEAERFLYKHRNLSDGYEAGIVLYRNSFSISSYEGNKDWVELGKRSRKSPAAATHKSGAWRVRENQLAGKIEIDKERNFLLADLSNRQGLDENLYYEIFIKILDVGIATFERYRQKIVRSINVKNELVQVRDKEIMEKIIRKPEVIKNLSKDEVKKFITEVKDYRVENKKIQKEIDITEKRYKYDIRILNVLATSGLKATSIAHEMRNDRNIIAKNYDFIVEAMKKYEIWDVVNEEKNTKYAFSNIPEILRNNKRVNSKIMSFMDTMLSEVEKGHFLSKEHIIVDLIKALEKQWVRDYTWVEIKIDISHSVIFKLPEDALKVIFDNLILNSIQNNDDKNHLFIYIKAKLNSDFLEIDYSDDGKGLNKKYITRPDKILEVHETSRSDGHGLGMWIVNNTIIMSGGVINKIEGKDGFRVNFSIGRMFR